MSKETTALDEFVADATSILQKTQHNLQELAQLALAKYERLPTDQDNGETKIRFQQIGQQLVNLSERSQSLQTYLQNGLEAPPVDDKQWPHVKILQSQEEERSQLARELEDSVGQLLANAVFELASCQYLLTQDKEAVSEGLIALQNELEQGLADIRHMITDLEPSTILSNFGLGGGIRRYLEQFETRTGIKSMMRINTNLGRLPTIIEVAIFRIIQEALQNIQRHAGASQVDVILSEKDAGLEFSVIDNGQGFISDRADPARKNLGLARMVDYAELLSGKLRIFSNPGQGTQVVLTIPYHTL